MKPWWRNLTLQVLTAVAIGLAIGLIAPKWGVALKPISEAFIRLVHLVVGPVVFLTIVVGVAGIGDLKKVGKVGGKALLYFEIATTIALMIGLIVANVAQPGRGIDIAAANTPQAASTVADYAQKAKEKTVVGYLLNIIPQNIVGAFSNSDDLLPLLFFSVIFGFAVAGMGPRKQAVLATFERATEAMFRVVAIVMKVAPLGALGAMAYTVGAFGPRALLPLASLMGCVYLTMAIFIFGVLGLICAACRFPLLKFLVYIKNELVLVLGTSSSESALPRLIEKLELMGCSKNVVGLVVPAGYSFNLDGTSIYLSMGVLFIAQAYGIHMSIAQQLSLMGILMLTSKGAAGVTGSGFITLAATLGATGVLPVEGVVLLLGVDRFMSEARAITNLIGNGVATVVVSKWEGEFNAVQCEAAFAGNPLAVTPEARADLLAE